MTSREFPLADLLDAAHAVESDRPVDPELLKALHPGTGGARPKCNVRTDGAVWIAKFPSLHDEASISIPRLEHATLQLAAACGLQAASSRLLQINGQDVCLVRRFDRILAENEQVHRQAYVSARTVFFADPGYANMATGSYGRLARWMTRYGCVAEQRKELYRRMVFNVAVRNSDDHELNHGLVQIGGQFQLADAFDLLPTLTPHRVHRHALLIGDSAAGTVNNLLSNATAFGLSVDEAKGVIADLQAMIQDKWQDTLYAAGFGDDEIRRLEPYFAPIPWSS
jgi:serine/threonine-protein kinase HipA